MSGTDIFLSYARQDRTTARMFAECLADEGFSVWWDASLHSGETFDEVIERNLREAGAVVVLWSPRSVASRWVRAEATLADRRNKLAPAIIEPCDRPIIFELTHAADLCDWAGEITDLRWRTFVDDLRRLIDAEAHGAARSDNARSAPANGGAASARAQSAERRPLRPGNDEVIFAGQKRNEPSGPQPRHTDLAKTSDGDALADVHCLQVEEGELGSEVFVVDSSGAKIGRTAPADIVLSHKSISREHCIIGLANDELLVTDLNSTNGTYIDDVRISRATVLPVGSVLRLGQISLRHALHSASDSEPRSGLSRGLQAGRLAAAS